MSEETMEEGHKKQGEKTSSSGFKIDKKFLIVAFFLTISVVTVAFSTKYLFDSDTSDWHVTQGNFIGEEGRYVARSPDLNWAYHESGVAYGEWEWDLRYYGSGSASIIFVSLEQDEDYYYIPTKGYKLVFEIGEDLALVKINGAGSEVTLNSTFFKPEAITNYKVKVVRATNNTFSVFINDEFKLRAFDSEFTTSDALVLYWYNLHQLDWVHVSDYVGSNGWSDYFTGLPRSDSNNIFTRIALYMPFATLGLVLLFYLFRLVFSEGSWTRFIVPLVLAVIIGFGYGYLVNFLRELTPKIEPTTTPTNTTSPDPTTDNQTSISPTGNQTGPLPTSSPDTGGGFTGLNKPVISTVLLVISGVFIIVAVVFVGIDFFRKRGDEFHEQILDSDKRWLPTATATDHRKRVIRAYHKASYDLIDHGAKSERNMTPGDFEKSTKEKFDLPDESLEDLTDLYEEARYSEHEISAKNSDKAEIYLDSITTNIRKTTLPEDKKPSDYIIEDKLIDDEDTEKKKPKKGVDEDS
ncbi:MAG: DUF4129 domain-containing protein [Candidatus Heimdallarchaeota archaeon]